MTQTAPERQFNSFLIGLNKSFFTQVKNLPGKGFETIVEAIPLCERRREISVKLYGAGDLRGRLESMINSGKASDAISINPYHQNWWGILKSAKLLISMSEFEGAPNVILEAMAAGIPIILSDIPQHRELLDDESATFIELGNVQMLARAIDCAITNSDALMVKVDRARSLADEYSLENSKGRYRELYEGVMRRFS